MHIRNGSNQRNRQDEHRRLGDYEEQSSQTRYDSDKTINQNSKRRNNTGKSIVRRRIIAGGILSQLIDDIDDQLADLHKQTKRLEARKKEFMKLQSSLEEVVLDRPKEVRKKRPRRS